MKFATIDNDESLLGLRIGESVHPLRDELLVRRIQPTEEVTSSGLVVPQVEQPKWHRALVCMRGIGRTDKHGRLIPMSVRVGDVVLIGAFVGVNVRMAEDPHGEYLMIPEREVIGVVDLNDPSIVVKWEQQLFEEVAKPRSDSPLR